MRQLSFRARLTLAAAAAVALAVALASLAVYFVARAELRDQLDTGLADRAEQIARSPLRELRHSFYPAFPAPLLGGAGGYTQLVGADGSVRRPLGAEEALPVSDRVLAVARGEEGSFYQDAHVAGTHVRILTVELLPGLALQIARPLTEVDDVLADLRLILLLIAMGGVALAGVLGLAVARAALAPARRLTQAAEEITATGDLSRRVEVGGRDELGRLAASFNTMLGALEQAVRAQRQLVADASHELRTPLTSLRTNVELLARGDGLSPDERRRVLDDVEAELEELTGLVADVVELARDGEQVLHVVEDLRLDALVADAVERARRHAPGLLFQTELEETVVRGDPARLHRAVSNILDNAAKWSPPGGLVEVRVRAGEVAVRDYGPGIAPEDLPHVFDRFYRSPAARSMPGSGLGLAIVRQVAESHGGSATAEAAQGGGTIVRLRLPESS
jgi:two-component system sensor histidine kinase MprB